MGRAVNKKCCAMLRDVYKVTEVKTACRHTVFPRYRNGLTTTTLRRTRCQGNHRTKARHEQAVRRCLSPYKRTATLASLPCCSSLAHTIESTFCMFPTFVSALQQTLCMRKVALKSVYVRSGERSQPLYASASIHASMRSCARSLVIYSGG